MGRPLPNLNGWQRLEPGWYVHDRLGSVVKEHDGTWTGYPAGTYDEVSRRSMVEAIAAVEQAAQTTEES